MREDYMLKNQIKKLKRLRNGRKDIMKYKNLVNNQFKQRYFKFNQIIQTKLEEDQKALLFEN